MLHSTRFLPCHRARIPGRRRPARPLDRGKRGGPGPVNHAYEVLLMLDPELPEERQDEIVTRTRELIEGRGGVIEKHEPWGRRKLAYQIDHKDEGTYHLLLFSSDADTLDELS